MSLPKFQTAIRELQDLMSRWATILDPIVDNPMSAPLILSGIQLKAGRNDVAHRLGRKLQGWQVVRQNGTSAFYDAQDLNQNPHLTLTLYSSQAVTISLAVF